MSFIRSSKVRHVYGQPTKKDLRYEGFRCPATGGSDGAQIAANEKLLAVCIGSGGSGSFAALPLSRTGRQEMESFQITAHSSYITDMQWNPFDSNMLATGSEGGSIKLWQIPDTGVMRECPKQLLELDYHQKRVVQLVWHPAAKNMLMSLSVEPCLAIWNLDTGEASLLLEDELKHVLYSADFSPDGTKIATSSKDKKFRIYDARSGDLLQEGDGHKGGKSQRIIFLSENRLFSTGFSSMSKRQYSVWNVNDLSKHLMQDAIDTSNATLIPYFHKGLNLLFIAGRGDSVIRYYEICDDEPYIHYIDTYQSKEPQRGLAIFPFYAVDTTKNEVVRFYKLAESSQNKGYVEAIQFIVPRKSDQFQEDLYPDTASNVPALAASEWQSGSNAKPNMFSFVEMYNKESKNKKAAKAKGLGGGGLGGLSGGGGGLKGSSTPSASAASAKKVTEKKTETPAPAPVKEPAKTAAPAKTQAKTEPAPVAAAFDSSKLEAEIKRLKEQVEKQAKLEEKVEALEEVVKKNNERIAVLESLVQEESDEEK